MLFIFCSITQSTKYHTSSTPTQQINVKKKKPQLNINIKIYFQYGNHTIWSFSSDLMKQFSLCNEASFYWRAMIRILNTINESHLQENFPYVSQTCCLIYWLLVLSSLNHTIMLNLVTLNFDDVNLRHSSVKKGKTDCIHLLYSNRISYRTEHHSKNHIWGVKLLRKSVI